MERVLCKFSGLLLFPNSFLIKKWTLQMFHSILIFLKKWSVFASVLKEAVLVNWLQKIAKSVSSPSHAICLAKMALSLDNKALLLYHFVLKQTQQTVTPEQSPLQIKKHCIYVKAYFLNKFPWKIPTFNKFDNVMNCYAA